MLETVDRTEVGKSLSTRDEIDSNRAVSPLTQAEDAAVIDSTRLSLQEVVDQVWKWLNKEIFWVFQPSPLLVDQMLVNPLW
jgi:Cytidylate kinase